METVISAIQELTESAKAVNKPDEKCCNSCQLITRLRLIESDYSEDMSEIYRRLDELEEKCQNAYAGTEW